SLAALMLADQFLQYLHGQLLAGFPAVEAIVVMLHEEHQLVAVVRETQLDRRAEAAQQRRQRLFGNTLESEGLLGLGHRQHATAALRCSLTLQAQRQFITLRIEQA